MTCEELIDRVRNSVDGVEVDASPRDINVAILRAGMTLSGIALNRLDEAEREYQLQDLTRAGILRPWPRQRRRVFRRIHAIPHISPTLTANNQMTRKPNLALNARN